MDPMIIDTLLTALASAVLVMIGVAGVLVLPWSEQELTASVNAWAQLRRVPALLWRAATPMVARSAHSRGFAPGPARTFNPGRVTARQPTEIDARAPQRASESRRMAGRTPAAAA